MARTCADAGIYPMGEAVITLEAAGDLLGIERDALVSAGKRGWIRVYQRRRQAYAKVSLRTMQRFIATPRSWLLVAPDDIPDPELRWIAQDAQKAHAPARWWTTREIAEAVGLSRSAVVRRRAEGWGTDWERWGPHWFLFAAEPPPIGNGHDRRKDAARAFALEVSPAVAAHGLDHAAAQLNLNPDALRCRLRRAGVWPL
jgi:hypothetical protein